MSEITITGRIWTMIQRTIEVVWDEFVEEGKEIFKNKRRFRLLDDSREFGTYKYFTYPDNFKMIFLFDTDLIHHEDCDNDECSRDCEENCKKVIRYSIEIKYKDLVIKKFEISEIIDEDDVLKMIGSLETTFFICQCGELAERRGWCKGCYIYRSNHPNDEVCPICYENEGRYIKTTCNHYFHRHCYHKINTEKPFFEQKRKCPLCREITTYSNHF